MILFVAHAPKIVDAFATDTVPEVEETAAESAAAVEAAPAPAAANVSNDSAPAPAAASVSDDSAPAPAAASVSDAVSYTHLTLPTILLV